MPSYQIEFVDGGGNREPVSIHCVDDAQALSWASGLPERVNDYDTARVEV
jgi:hypothetical protein